MRRIMTVILCLALVLSLAACGGGEEKASVDLNTLYEACKAEMPAMMLLEGDTRMNFLGIDEADCKQLITAIAEDGMVTDEIWLVEAVDQEALDRISDMAQARIQAKADETVTYSPEQYAVVEKAQVVQKDLYLVLLVTGEAETLKADVEAALS